MATREEKRDKHFPLLAHDNLFRRLFSNPNEFCAYVTKGQVIVDLGCGPGYYTLALAESVGPEGRVYAVDSDEKAIRALANKADKHGYHNIELYASTASDLSFIEDESVDFVLANGLLCNMPVSCGCCGMQVHRSGPFDYWAFETGFRGPKREA